MVLFRCSDIGYLTEHGTNLTVAAPAFWNRTLQSMDGALSPGVVKSPQNLALVPGLLCCEVPIVILCYYAGYFSYFNLGCLCRGAFFKLVF